MKPTSLTIYFTAIIAIVSCKSHTSTLSKINFRDYFYPIESLQNGKVYCYADIKNYNIKRFEKVQSSFNETDTFLTITTYDSLFREEDVEKDLINKEEYNVVYAYGIQFGNSDTPQKKEINVKESSTKWNQILLDPKNSDDTKPAFHHLATAEMENHILIISTIGRLYKYDGDSSIPTKYSFSSSVKVIEEATLSLDAKGSGKELTRTNSIYFSKNIGPIFYIEKSPVTGNEKDLSLQKIISVPEFESLVESNRNFNK